MPLLPKHLIKKKDRRYPTSEQLQQEYLIHCKLHGLEPDFGNDELNKKYGVGPDKITNVNSEQDKAVVILDASQEYYKSNAMLKQMIYKYSFCCTKLVSQIERDQLGELIAHDIIAYESTKIYCDNSYIPGDWKPKYVHPNPNELTNYQINILKKYDALKIK